ncbi:MAG: efflux RND transporter permease subunit, partial [Dehalococcoidia bacterium]|nr:efflux RND transporter permease subunit [Dehalococcoidia bacterium]
MLLTRLAFLLRLVFMPFRAVIAFVETVFERFGMIPTRLALRVRIVTIILLVALIATGIWSYTRLQVEFLPSVDFPLVTVVTFYPGASPETVLEDVTVPIEQILLEQENVNLVQSSSSLNLSVAFAEFEFGSDTVAIERAVQEAVDRLEFPPTVAEPNVGRLNFQQFPVLQVSVRSNQPPEELKAMVERDILPRLREVPGVNSADIPANAGGEGVINRTNGLPSLTIGVVKGPDDNTVEVTNAALAELDDIKTGLPPDVEFTVTENQGPEIQDSIDTLGREVALGAVLAILVILGFLLSVRPTFVTGISIPASLLIGIIVMNLQGMSLNLVTLGGLAIAAGRVVDDSIVVMENIYRHIQDGEDRLHAAYEGTKEVALPITIATMTTIAVFAPLGFIGGIVSEFFLPFALVITFALLASLAVALTAVPALASFLIRRHSSDTAEEVLSRRIVRFYTPIVTWALGHRLYTI